MSKDDLASASLPAASGARSARPTVDVGVVSWNTGELTAAALRRTLDFDQGCDLRLLVHDNGSTDGTVAILTRLVPEAEIEAGRTNLGFAAGANRLLARSDADWFFLLNSDAWPEPGAIATLVEAARRNPAAAAIAPRIERPDGTLEHSTYPFPSLRVAWLLARKVDRMEPARAEEMLFEGAWRHDKPRSVDWAIGAALLMPREAILDIGGFDERFFMYVEDLDWCWRARSRGWDIRFEPSAVVCHIGNASGAQNYAEHRTAAYLRNTYRFFSREHGSLAALVYRGLNLAAVMGLYVRARRGGNDGEAGYWKRHLRAHLSFGRNDRPPSFTSQLERTGETEDLIV